MGFVAFALAERIQQDEAVIMLEGFDVPNVVPVAGSLGIPRMEKKRRASALDLIVNPVSTALCVGHGRLLEGDVTRQLGDKRCIDRIDAADLAPASSAVSDRTHPQLVPRPGSEVFTEAVVTQRLPGLLAGLNQP
jgi:hypothetical protein